MRPRATNRHLRRWAAAAVIAGVLLPLPQVLPSIISTNLLLVREGDALDEDVYVTASRAQVDGVIDGDLVIAANDLTVTGEIRGDVIAAVSGKITISGTVQGAVRGGARQVEIQSSGVVEDDLFLVSGGAQIRGRVGRDVVVFGGPVAVDGAVGRDVTGRMVGLDVDGAIGRDVDVVVASLELGPNAVVDGDVLYRSDRGAVTSGGARIGGQFVRLPTRSSFAVEVGLTVATIVGFLGFLLLGIVVFWAARSTGPRAAGMILTRPWRVLGVGLATVILTPVAVAVLVATLVGVPMALLVLGLMALGLIVGPVPALTAFGDRVTRGRGGVFGSFLVGAVVFRGVVWLIPVLGFALYLAALVWGIGGWAVGAWEQRRVGLEDAPDLVPARVAAPPAEWEPPLPPLPDHGEIDDEAGDQP